MLAALAVILFFPTIWFGLVIWDDPLNIVENPYVKSLSVENLYRIWAKPYGDLYVPLVYTTYAIEIAVSRAEPWILHLTNVLLHAGSGLAVYSILIRLGLKRRSALIGAALFIIHPLQVEPVAWITGRKDVLSGCLSLWSIEQYLSWRDRGARWAYIRSVIFFVLALTAKPAAVAVPLLLACFELFGKRRDLKQSGLALLPFFAGGVVWAIVTSGAQPVRDKSPLWERPFIAGDALWFYLRKLILPESLVAVYGRTPHELLLIPGYWIGLPLASLVLGIALFRGNARVRLAAALFVAALAPVLGVVPFRYQNYSTVADRYMYVAMLAAGLAVAQLVEWLESRKVESKRLVIGAAVIGVVLSAITLRQEFFWRDSEMLMRRCIEIAPRNGAAHCNLALVYADRKQWPEAIRELETGLKTLRHPDLYNNYGYALLQVNRPEEAIDSYRKALALEPNLPSAHRGIGDAYYQYLNQSDKAIPEYRESLRLDPTRNSTRVFLGLAYDRVGRYGEAVEQFKKAAEVSPQDHQIYSFLCESLASMGRFAEAGEALRKADQYGHGKPEVLRAAQTLKAKAQRR